VRTRVGKRAVSRRERGIADPGAPDRRPSVLSTDSRRWAYTGSVPTTLDVEHVSCGAALRVTRPRVAVLTAVYEQPHADADPIVGVVCEDLGEVSARAVYDLLRALPAADLLRRAEQPGSVARAESWVGDNHHHAGCRSCGASADDSAVADTACLTASGDHGYSIDEAAAVDVGARPACSTPHSP